VLASFSGFLYRESVSLILTFILQRFPFLPLSSFLHLPPMFLPIPHFSYLFNNTFSLSHSGQATSWHVLAHMPLSPQPLTCKREPRNYAVKEAGL
jgi:hypothetical protein